MKDTDQAGIDPAKVAEYLHAVIEANRTVYATHVVEKMQGKSKRHPAFEVEELERIREYLQQNRVEIKEEPVVPGLKRFSFFDPFDNRIEFMERV